MGVDTRQVWGLGGCFDFASLSWGWGEAAVSYSFPFTTQPGSLPPQTQNLTMKEQEGGSVASPHFKTWEKELGFGGQTAPAQPG